jgi:phosphatidylserine/phosphatidylglycerophosphate/cardiolipin synthase-like enzyme
MRLSKTSQGLKVNAIAGTYVVVLGLNLPRTKCKGLLGFSVHRTDHTENELYFLEAMKAFKETDPGFPSGSLYSTRDHPIQSFQWADYSAKPGHKYTYKVTALKGTPQNLIPFAATSVPVTTESPETGDHDVYFNRGSAASQEYVRRFGDKSPKDVPNDKAFEWLSRGLYEALEKFITSCKPGKHSLRIAAYEFNFAKILNLIKQVKDTGVDIEVVYDARKASPGKINVDMVEHLGLDSFCTPRTEGKSYISHNKFIVKLEGQNKKPVSVWTGGANFSDGGIYGHSNVAHVVEDTAIAQLYLDYWNELKADPKNPPLKTEVEQLTPLPAIPVPKGTSVLFSPRKNLDALDFYAKLATNAQDGLFMTFAFGMNKIFRDVYENSTAPMRLALMEKKTRPMEEGPEKDAEEKFIDDLRRKIENVFAIGDFIRTNEFDGWVKERLTGLNTNVRYVHNKFMLVDPLSNDPIVIAGSANFSAASTEDNDENMLVIRGNKRVADIYLGEFMRLFSHFSFRESLKWRKPDEPPKPLRTDDWWEDNFENTARSSRRKFFAQVAS